jgi:hypothetical protein
MKIGVSQSLTATMATDSSHYEVGDHINLKINVAVPKNLTVIIPQIKDSISENVEVIATSKLDTISGKKSEQIIVNQNFTMIIFEAGEYSFPAMPVYLLRKNDGLIDSIFTNPLTLNITAPEVDMEGNIKDIKDIWKFPITFKEILPYLIGFLILIVIVFVGIFIYIRRKNNKPIFQFKAKPVIPPHIVAQSKLDNLKTSQLWQQNLVKEYYTQLTDILREYIEKALKIQAIEMTSDELLLKIKNANIQTQTPENQSQIIYTIKDKNEILKITEEILSIADLAKFAKYQPFIDEHDKCFKLVTRFINETTVENADK